MELYFTIILFIRNNYNTSMMSIGHFSIAEISFKLINLASANRLQIIYIHMLTIRYKIKQPG